MADNSPHSQPDQPPAPASDRRLESSSAVVAFLGMGLGMGLCLFAGVGIGLAVDALAHTSPWFTLVGLAFGLVMGVAYMVWKVRENL